MVWDPKELNPTNCVKSSNSVNSLQRLSCSNTEAVSAHDSAGVIEIHF